MILWIKKINPLGKNDGFIFPFFDLLPTSSLFKGAQTLRIGRDSGHQWSPPLCKEKAKVVQ